MKNPWKTLSEKEIYDNPNNIFVGGFIGTPPIYFSPKKKHIPHKAAKTTEGSPTVFAEGEPVLRVGSGNSCGHKIKDGSPDVFVP